MGYHDQSETLQKHGRGYGLMRLGQAASGEPIDGGEPRGWWGRPTEADLPPSHVVLSLDAQK